MSIKSIVGLLTPQWLPPAVAHLGFAYIVTSIFSLHDRSALSWVIPLGVLLAGIKEFYIDKHYETNPQTFLDNLSDFSEYAAGIILALIICRP